jgi:hypothetical protein
MGLRLLSAGADELLIKTWKTRMEILVLLCVVLLSSAERHLVRVREDATTYAIQVLATRLLVGLVAQGLFVLGSVNVLKHQIQ